MKEKILNITIGALIEPVVSVRIFIKVKMNRKIGSLNGMPTSAMVEELLTAEKVWGWVNREWITIGPKQRMPKNRITNTERRHYQTMAAKPQMNQPRPSNDGSQSRSNG